MQQRIEGIDLLRGFALLGLPTMNMIVFSMPSSAYINPTSYAYLEFLNHFLFSFFHIFADQKFMGLFSLLFGASLLLLAKKSEVSGKKAFFIHYSRMFWLFLIGLLHALYLWDGDILTTYAILGLLLYPLKNLRVRWLLLIAALMMLGAVLCNMTDLNTPIMGGQEIMAVNAFYQPSALDIQQLKWIYQGDYQGVQQYFMSHFSSEVAPNRLLESFVFSAILRAFAMMCLGMALFKLGILQGTFSDVFYHRLVRISLLISLPLISLGLFYNYWNQWQLESFATLGSVANLVGSIPLVLAYIGLFILFQKSDNLHRVKSALQNVGRMALTNYLMQSVICAFIFYGYGLGLYGELSRLQLLPIILFIWVLQLVGSTWWLSYFKQGPVEWTWRMLTYLRWQNPLRSARKSEV